MNDADLALYIAAERDDLPAVEAALAAGADPSCRDDEEATPLDRARAEGRQAAVVALGSIQS